MNQHVSGTKRSSTARILLKLGVFLVVAAIGGYSILSFLAQRGNVEASVSWDQEFGTLEDRLALYPQRSTNREALEMQRLVEPLGISLKPRENFGEMPTVDDPEFHGIRDGIDVYLKRQLTREDFLTDLPPDSIATYLTNREPELDAVREFLLTSSTPFWTRDLERLFSGPFFNPRGHADLHLVLLADAVAAITAGERNRALADLEASWRFLGAVREDLYVDTLARVFRVAQRQVAIVRLIDDPGEVWYARFDPRTLRQPALDALRHYGWIWSHVDETIRWNSDMHPIRKVMSIAAKPYVQLCEIGTLADYRPNLSKLIELDYLCDRDLGQAGIRLDWPVPWWNQLGDHVSASVRSFVDVWRQLEFDYEATRRWMQAAGSIDGIEASLVCPNDAWVYRADGPDGPELAFSRDPSWPETSPTLALGYRFPLDR
jgi:hypothetical protein